MRARWGTLLTFAGTLSLAIASASPPEADGLAPLASGGGAGVGWGTFLVDGHGERVRITLEITGVREWGSLGVFTFDEAGRVHGGSGSCVEGRLLDRVDASIDGPFGVKANFSRHFSNPSKGTCTLTSIGESLHFERRIRVVVVGAGNIEGWSYLVEGEGAAEARSGPTGSQGVVLAFPRDFRGLAIAEVHGLATAWAAVEGTVRLSGNHGPIGSFQTLQPSAGKDMRATFGNVTMTCPCVVGDRAGPWTVGSSPVTFHLTGAGVEPLDLSTPVLLGVEDVELPPA